MAVIDDHLLQLQLRNDEAQMARINADIDYNRRQMKRLQQLAEQNNMAQSELDEVESRMAMLAQDPFHPRLETHKLKGKLAGSWACSAGFNLRIVFDFVKNTTGGDEILLIEVGTHDELLAGNGVYASLWSVQTGEAE